MSDGFDKEAEREKLREKFAEDEEQREHTQRMSELLLQGATMTNRHCDACGDPIFRHDGREFCPSCHATEDGYAVPADEGPPEETAGGAAANGSPAPAGGEHATGETGAVRNPGAGNAGATPDPQSSPAPDPQSSPAPDPQRGATATSDSAAVTPGGLDDARASLTRTLTRFARKAEETDDPRRARDHLEAAREAAEAIAALDG